MITRTIGSGAQHADINLWVAYVQANVVVAGLLTDDVTGAIVKAGCTVTAQQIISGWAPGISGFETILTANAGDGFRDNPNVRTTALIYNASNGAFFTSSYSASAGALDVQVNKFRLKYLEWKTTGGYTNALSTSTVAINDFLVDSCIIDCAGSDAGAIELHSTFDGTATAVQNCLIMNERSASNSSCISINGGCTTNPLNIYDNTFWVDQSATDVIAAGSYGKLNAIGNVFPDFDAAGFSFAMAVRDANATGSNNATIDTAWKTPFGGGLLTGLTASQFSIVPTNEFIGSSTTSPTDFRLKVGGTQLQGTGTTISGITTDISGFPRAPGSVDIGCWQLTAGSGTNINLTGAAAAAGFGSFTKTASKTLTGVAAVAGVGSLKGQDNFSLSAATANAAAAAFTARKDQSKTLTGVAATGLAEPFTPSQGSNVNLTGAAAAGAAAPFAQAQVSKALTGVAAIATAAGFGTSDFVSLVGAAASAAARPFASTSESVPLGPAIATAGFGLLSPGGSLNQQLIAAAAHGQAGSFSPTSALSKALTAATAVGAAAPFVVSHTVLLVSASAVAGAGAFALSKGLALTGVQALGTAAAFSIGKGLSLDLAGVAALANARPFILPTNIAFLGVAALGAAGTMTPVIGTGEFCYVVAMGVIQNPLIVLFGEIGEPVVVVTGDLCGC